MLLSFSAFGFISHLVAKAAGISFVGQISASIFRTERAQLMKASHGVTTLRLSVTDVPQTLICAAVRLTLQLLQSPCSVVSHFLSAVMK